MGDLPEDVLVRVKSDFPDKGDFEEVMRVIDHVRNDSLNVGWVQLVRAMLILAEGDIQIIRDILQTGYRGDPRDVIMEMMAKPGVNNDHGLSPFE